MPACSGRSRRRLPLCCPRAAPGSPAGSERGECSRLGDKTQVEGTAPSGASDVTSEKVSLPELEAKEPDTGASTEREVQRV